MHLRGNLRELLNKLRGLFKQPGRLKPKAYVSLILFFLMLVFAGVLALTSEKDEEAQAGLAAEPEDEAASEDAAEEMLPSWQPPGPPRWFRSNAGGMALEEIPSRLAALRNRYALVIDYVSADELDPLLAPFYSENFSIEIRVLFERREELRRQWLFLDEAGNVRVNGVFTKTFDDAQVRYDEESAPDDEDGDTQIADGESPDADAAIPGFIEIFNAQGRIVEDHWFTEDGEETLTVYSYNSSLLIKAETKKKKTAEPKRAYRLMYTDNYRYNRSYSLRNVERFYHEAAEAEPIRLVFPGRVLDAAYDLDFISEKLSHSSDFFGDHSAGAGYSMIYDTDSRGRILSQTMLDENGEAVWAIQNTWLGDRIVSIMKTEGDEVLVTEYDYDSAGARVAQRDIRDGVLERQVLINGDRETEELFLNGAVVLRAYWEDGRKISEERVRRR